jgi:LPS-assembly protein
LAPLGRILAIALAALALATLPHPLGLRGQDIPVSLVADQVAYDEQTETLTAIGSVEVLYDGRLLRARSITYDARAEVIRAEGPVTLTDPDGNVFIADEASLDADLKAGLIRGARLMVGDQLQLAATEVRRSQDRYTTMHRVVASSCTVCPGNPTPTWAVRASRVTQDEAAQRIYFDHATFEVLGLPVAYLPWLSVPDPRVERASGFLSPDFRRSTIYGSGIRLPYYHVIGPSADATVTPFITTDGAVLVEGEYRRRFSNGGFDLWGVLAIEDGMGDSGRGAFSSLGAFALRDGFIADFDINVASDRSFLQQFDYSDADRLTSFARIHRTRANEYFGFGALGFQSLREDQPNDGVPQILPEFYYRRSMELPGAGGLVGMEVESLAIWREVGRDVVRMGGGVDWKGDWLLPRGVMAGATAVVDVDLYQVRDDPDDEDGTFFRTTPTAAAELRWPLVRYTAGAAHVIEPIAQAVYTKEFGADIDEIPNEDSQLPEFDETNLFALNRFPGRDRYETGLRANLGIGYTRFDPAGWSLGFTVGRVVRADGVADFSDGSGLAGRWSDYVAALSLETDWGLRLSNRSLFDDDIIFRRNELGLRYETERADFMAAYTYFAADDSNPVLGPVPETNELLLDGRYRLRPNWEVRGLWRYDLEAAQSLRAGAGVRYGNDCTEFDLSISRRFTSSDNVPPSTSIGFNVRLAGFGDAGEVAWPEQVCRAVPG